MRKLATNRILPVLAIALAFGVADAVSAATSAGSVSVSGTVTNPPPPASCSLGSQTIDASFAVPPEGAYNYVKTANLSINCTSGTTYSVKAPAAQNYLRIGVEPTGLQVGIISTSTNKNIANFPVAGTGNGAVQLLPVRMTFMRTGGQMLLDGGGASGAVSGAVILTVTY